MGGTFDPIHMGHLVCADQACEALGLDAMLFVPTGRPAFKRDRSVTAGDLRLDMVRAATSGNESFAVGALEVKRPGITYAVDTLRELRRAMPPSTEIVFVVGADAALSLPRWRASDEIASLAAFGVAMRPGFTWDEGSAEALRWRGFDIRPFATTSLDISSSDIRQRVAASRSIRYLVPDAVRAIIDEEHLYRKEALGG